METKRYFTQFFSFVKPLMLPLRSGNAAKYEKNPPHVAEFLWESSTSGGFLNFYDL